KAAAGVVAGALVTAEIASERRNKNGAPAPAGGGKLEDERLALLGGGAYTNRPRGAGPQRSGLAGMSTWDAARSVCSRRRRVPGAHWRTGLSPRAQRSIHRRPFGRNAQGRRCERRY